MRILAIDTTKQNSHIVLYKDGTMDNVLLDVKTKVSESLLPNIENILSQNNMKLRDNDAFAVVVGPGSFTGVRVGVATIKAFAQALNKPVIAIDSFSVMNDVICHGRLYLKCTNTSVYYADYEGNKVINRGVIENVKATLNNIVQLENEIAFDDVEYMLISKYPKILCDAVIKAYNNKAFVPFNQIEPMYIQLSQAELALKQKEDKK